MKSKKKKARILWTSLSVVILIVIGLAGCAAVRRRRQAANAPDPGDIVTAFVGDLSASASAGGQLLPKQEAGLAMSTAGWVEQVHIRVGDQVLSGDILVRLESSDLERAVASAEQNLAIQEANLAELRTEADPVDVAAARAAIANAQAQLDDLNAGPSEEELAQAQATLVSAQTRLADLLAGPSEEELAQAQATLVSALAALEGAKARSEALDDQLVVAQNDIHNAQLAIDRARDMYEQLVWNSRDQQVAESWGPYSPQAAALRNAQISYDAAVANQTLTAINVNDSAYRAAQAQVAQAKANLAMLTDEQTAQIAAAKAQIASAEANLARLTEEKTTQIASARAQLAQAQANLARLLDGPSREQLAIAEAQVAQARISLEAAQDNLADATLVAPFDGMVTAVHIAVGERVSREQSGRPVVELVNTNSLQVVLDVDEVDVGVIEVGQSALVTLETWPDRELSAEVVYIAPKAEVIAGIVTYEVRLRLDAGGLPVLTGMTANAELITARRENALLVPNRAITVDRQAAKYYVNKVEGQETTRVEVMIGLRDHSYTEIKGGIAKGDRLFIGEVDEGLDFEQGPPEGMRRGF